MSMLRGVLVGAAAGAAGTTALNAVTYLDMALRGRASSNTPQDTVEALAKRAGVTIPGDQATRDNRVEGLAPLTGITTGVGVGALMGLLRGIGFNPPSALMALIAGSAAMALSNGSMASLGVSDPRTWTAKDWISDAIPHASYGAVVTAVLHTIDAR